MYERLLPYIPDVWDLTLRLLTPTAAMGGSGSQEFMVKSEVGEDGIAYCANAVMLQTMKSGMCSTGGCL